MKNLFIFFLYFSVNSFSQAQLPKNLSECNIYFDKKLSPKDIKYIKRLSADELASLHLGLGMNIRNSWIHGDRNPELVNYFRSIEIYHPDDISSIIIKNYWHYLNKTFLDLKNEIAFYHDYWEKSRIKNETIEKKTIETEQKIFDNYLNIKYNNPNTLVLKLPDYKTDSPLFSNEFIKYKNGYIINSLTTSPGKKTEVNYRYYYIDLKTNQLFKLNFKAFDSVQSVTNLNSTLYVAGKKNKKLKIIAQTNEKTISLNLPISENKKKKNYEEWIKLGIYRDTLFALQPDGLFYYDRKDWKLKENLNLDSYFRKYYGRNSLIPTENIRITPHKVYFLQEISQMRDCELFEYDFRSKEISEFWDKHKLIDKYKQEISTYTISNDNNLIVASERSGSNILLSEKNTSLNFYLYNGKVKSDTINNLNIRKVIKKDDSLLLVGENGLFQLKNEEITKLATLENTEQIIDYDKSRYHFKFYPRSCEIINEDEYLIGGMFGGLYRINLKENTIICLDDNNPPQTIDILN